jgi:hypothetical protein
MRSDKGETMQYRGTEGNLKGTKKILKINKRAKSNV